MLAALWVVPLIARAVPQATYVPLAAPMLTAFALLLQRAIVNPQPNGVLPIAH